MTSLLPGDMPHDETALTRYLIDLIEEGRRIAARQVSATLAVTYWQVGQTISTHVLRDDRAEYGQQIVGSLSQQLTARFGPGFDKSNLSRMMAFARLFPDRDDVNRLAHTTAGAQDGSRLSCSSYPEFPDSADVRAAKDWWCTSAFRTFIPAATSNRSSIGVGRGGEVPSSGAASLYRGVKFQVPVP